MRYSWGGEARRDGREAHALARREAKRAQFEASRAQAAEERAQHEASRAQAAEERAQHEASRAQAAEAELVRLRALLAKQS